MKLIEHLENQKLLFPPSWLKTNVSYLTTMGSQAYGCNDDDSDLDVYGFCIPPQELVFPHLQGEIPGFGRQVKRFEQFQQHHIVDPSARGGRGQEYDITCFSIVKYFNLAMENNPNILDSLFTSRECVIHSTHVAELVRENRKLFLHKGCWHKFRGYAHSQAAKIKTKTPDKGSRREEYIQKYGYDVKYAVHLVRLILECEQALTEGDIDLRKHSDLLKNIRKGCWTESQLFEWFDKKEKDLEPLYHSCTVLPYGPDEGKIKTLLLTCLEHHYGSLSKMVVVESELTQAMRKIKEITDNLTF
jgi:predicted nucleotidyltransferase